MPQPSRLTEARQLMGKAMDGEDTADGRVMIISVGESRAVLQECVIPPGPARIQCSREHEYLCS